MSKARDGEGPADHSDHIRKPPRNVGDLLKSAYQQTVQEDIPPEFLDLLGKLD